MQREQPRVLLLWLLPLAVGLLVPPFGVFVLPFLPLLLGRAAHTRVARSSPSWARTFRVGMTGVLFWILPGLAAIASAREGPAEACIASLGALAVLPLARVPVAMARSGHGVRRALLETAALPVGVRGVAVWVGSALIVPAVLPLGTYLGVQPNGRDFGLLWLAFAALALAGLAGVGWFARIHPPRPQGDGWWWRPLFLMAAVIVLAALTPTASWRTGHRVARPSEVALQDLSSLSRGTRDAGPLGFPLRHENGLAVLLEEPGPRGAAFIVTRDGGGSGEVRIPCLARLLVRGEWPAEHASVYREVYRGAPAWTLRIDDGDTQCLVTFDDEGVRRDDTSSDRIRQRWGGFGFAAAAALVLLGLLLRWAFSRAGTHASQVVAGQLARTPSVAASTGGPWLLDLGDLGSVRSGASLPLDGPLPDTITEGMPIWVELPARAALGNLREHGVLPDGARLHLEDPTGLLTARRRGALALVWLSAALGYAALAWAHL